MSKVLVLIGVLLCVSVIAGLLLAFVWDPFKAKYPNAAAGIRSAVIFATIAAVAFCGLSYYEEKNDQRQAEHDAEIWKEAYERGMNEIINNPKAYISFDEAYEKGYADGYDDGWHDCNNGVPLENPVITEFERTH